MKRIKNLTLGILGVTVLSLGLFACSNDDRVEDVTKEQNVMAAREGNIQKFYGRIPLPAEFETDASANFYSIIDVENEVVLEYKIDESVANAYKIDYSQLEELFKIEMGSLLYSLNGTPKDGGAKFTEHAGCIEACKDKYIVDGEEKEGLGACKANCWVDTGVKVAVAISKLLIK